MARQRRHQSRRRRRGRFGGLYKALSVLLIAGALAAACIVFFRVNTVEVTGNARYSAQEVIDASGVKLGDNLIALPRGRVSARIRTALPYVERVAFDARWPDGLVIRVTERVAAASVDSAEGRWLISAQGKVLEQDNGAVPVIRITGLTAAGPYAGGTLQAAEKEQLTLEYVLRLLQALEDHGILADCSALDCTAATSMTLEYGVYHVRLPRGGDYDYDIRLAMSALASGLAEGKLQEGQAGTLDLTIADGRARFLAD